MVVLPGFPTSAIVTFNLFVAPVIRRLANLPVEGGAESVEARLAVRYRSAEGRHEHVLVHLVPRGQGVPAAYPMAGASGSETSATRKTEPVSSTFTGKTVGWRARDEERLVRGLCFEVRGPEGDER